MSWSERFAGTNAAMMKAEIQKAVDRTAPSGMPQGYADFLKGEVDKVKWPAGEVTGPPESMLGPLALFLATDGHAWEGMGGGTYSLTWGRIATGYTADGATK